MNIKTFAFAVALALPSVAIFAQTPAPVAPSVVAAKPATISQRKENQQDRIGQGVTSGQLTPRETTHLERQEGAINKEESAMRAQNNGHLTRTDRKVLTHQQNQESKRIYRAKHNGRRS